MSLIWKNILVLNSHQRSGKKDPHNDCRAAFGRWSMICFGNPRHSGTKNRKRAHKYAKFTTYYLILTPLTRSQMPPLLLFIMHINGHMRIWKVKEVCAVLWSRVNESIAWLSSETGAIHAAKRKALADELAALCERIDKEFQATREDAWQIWGSPVLWLFCLDFHFMDVFPLTGTSPSRAQDMTKFSETKSQEVADGSWKFAPGKLINLALSKPLSVVKTCGQQWSVCDQFMIGLWSVYEFKMSKVTRVCDRVSRARPTWQIKEPSWTGPWQMLLRRRPGWADRFGVWNSIPNVTCQLRGT